MNDIQSMIDQLELWDEAYHNGDALVSDVQYDQVKLQAHKLQPNHPYFIQVGADVRGGKIKLPYTMGSLDQIYIDPDLYNYSKWLTKFDLNGKEIIVSHKLDGVSCMIQYKNGEFMIAYSRGDGVSGADYTRHVKTIKNLPLKIASKGHITIRGELIMSNDKFNTNWADTFANPRNMVAGVFNRKNTDTAAVDDVDFIAYQTVDCDDAQHHSSQHEDLAYLESLGFTTVKHSKHTGDKLNDNVLKELLAKARRESDYELDGIVLTINNKNHQKNLSNSSSLNPEHSVKFKVLDENSNVETKVVDVHYELSKSGFFKPRVEILPVKLSGATVTFATGFNGKYIVDNQIGPGTTIKITRSGQVIPYITEVITPTSAKLPTEAWDWNETKVEMVVKDAQNHPEVIFKQVLDFFNTLDVDLLKEASISKLIEALKLRGSSYEIIIETILSLIEMEWENILGSNGSKIYASLWRRIDNLTMATYLGAVKYFGIGFGVRKAKMLLKNLNSDDDVWELEESQVTGFDGFDIKTAISFVNGIYDAKAFFDRLGLTTIKETKSTELAAYSVVFTGFRDKDFQNKLEKLGAKVGSSVSKKTTHLITAEPNSTSSKAVKARELGIETLSLDEFKEKYNL